ncbi:MAG: type IV toxin-antitoxin system AbiEi family antitoxin domain-containing protein [Gemmatimonadota bacterium]|nr:type IV toxin-antitoxin system AbiEi family antitoxin domain-containing protein [Gemmatimonadota bacterium]
MDHLLHIYWATRMPTTAYDTVVAIAKEQHGLVTTSQARQQGVNPHTIKKMARRGNIERVSWGVYRVPSIPLTSYSEYMEAVLWPGNDSTTISYESALTMYGVSDVSPGRIHLTVPESYRTHRDVPKRLELHHADLEPGDIHRIEGVPVTTFERTIRDCQRAHIGSRLLRQAIEEGRREGYLTPDRAKRLLQEVLPGSAPGRS